MCVRKELRQHQAKLGIGSSYIFFSRATSLLVLSVLRSFALFNPPSFSLQKKLLSLLVGISVTILDDLLDFEQLFKACANNYFAQIVHIFRQFL